MANYIPTTSRQLDANKRAWLSVVYQSGKSILDSELNLAQELSNAKKYSALPSGVISRQNEGVFSEISTPNTLSMSAFTANVAGYEVYVGGTNSSDPSINLIELPEPDLQSGSPPDEKRTDFVFLEVWKALVSPPMPSKGYFRVVYNDDLVAGDTLTLDGSALGGGILSLVADTDFNIGATGAETARNIRDAINSADTLAEIGTLVTADAKGTEFVFLYAPTGTAGNNIAISVTLSVTAAITIKEFAGGTDGAGLSAGGDFFFAGNTQSDPSLNFANDLIDPEMGVETTQRVQLQYRFRVFSGVNPKTEIYGFDNTGVFAQGGNNSVVADYLFSRATGTSEVRPTDGGTNDYPYEDVGLFYSGEGTEADATALSSVDGYVYAIPICYVFRKSVGFFSPSLYANSALLSTHDGTVGNASLDIGTTFVPDVGESDRPDGKFSDLIYLSDILDLRRSVSPSRNTPSELTKQFHALLDNQHRTWAMDGSDYLPIGQGSGDISTTPLICDEIGRSVALGGEGDTTGRGNFIRNFDHIASRFSSAPVAERLVLEILPQTAIPDPTLGVIINHAVPGYWTEGDEIEIDLEYFDATGYFDWTMPGGPIRPSLLWPTGTTVTDVIEAWHDDGNYNATVSQTAHFSSITGLGTTTITLTLDRNQTAVTGGINQPEYPMVGYTGVTGSERAIYLVLLVEYPAGEGLSATPIQSLENPSPIYASGAVIEYDRNQRATDSEPAPPFVSFREGVREVLVERVVSTNKQLVSKDASSVRLPWKLAKGSYTTAGGGVAGGTDVNIDPQITDTTTSSSVPINAGASVYGSTESSLVFQSALPAQRLLQVNHYSLAPVSNFGTGYQIAVYYRAVAPQTCGTKADPISTLVPTTLTLEPLVISESLWSIQAGAGSSDESFPYASPSVQIGVSPSISEYNDEGSLQASSFVSLHDFSINSGLVSLPTHLPIDSNSEIVLKSPQLDQEARVVYTLSEAGIYAPSAYSKNLLESAQHKNAVPLLARVKEGSTLYRKGEVVLVVISRLSEPLTSAGSEGNYVALSSSASRTIACVYRTKNLLVSGE
jgi:hypothetical protein